MTTTISIDMTEAIRKGIITFEQACELSGIACENALDNAPKAPKAEKPKKAKKAKKAEEPKVEEPKVEEPETIAPVYTKGGAVIQYALNHTIKPANMRRINNAVDKAVKAGFCVSWKRVGGWVYLYHDTKADKKTSKEYKALKLAKGWKFIKGAWVDTDMLANYPDNFSA